MTEEGAAKHCSTKLATYLKAQSLKALPQPATPHSLPQPATSSPPLPTVAPRTAHGGSRPLTLRSSAGTGACPSPGEEPRGAAGAHRSAGCPRWRGSAARRRNDTGSPRTHPEWKPWRPAAPGTRTPRRSLPPTLTWPASRDRKVAHRACSAAVGPAPPGARGGGCREGRANAAVTWRPRGRYR